ncbi:MAG: hypothetical protein JST12_04755 [Armatimonadetes bacterium]|nr:hypothetical protein [Armatimonadota bacterium]
MPLEVYEAMRVYKSDMESVSVNQFVVEAVEEKLARLKEEELKRGFELLGQDFDMSEVEPWIQAQAETFEHIDG